MSGGHETTGCGGANGEGKMVQNTTILGTPFLLPMLLTNVGAIGEFGIR
ncbi:MAG: hypothetical protein JWR26_4272 [Pedosphaera sp.]|nr:hypothetical protein [Pedosphaera sp.]